MNVEPRFQPINQWSCCLACVVWNLERQHPKIEKSQDSLIHDFWSQFPKWSQQPGLLERGDILKLLTYVGSGYRRFIHTNKKEEFLDYFTKNSSAYLMGFVITRKDGQSILNHCMAISGIDGDFLEVMDATRFNPQIQRFSWPDLEHRFDADFLALFI
jgi:hypothetical protein